MNEKLNEIKQKVELAAKVSITGYHFHGFYKAATRTPAPLLKAGILLGASIYGAHEAYQSYKDIQEATALKK